MRKTSELNLDYDDKTMLEILDIHYCVAGCLGFLGLWIVKVNVVSREKLHHHINLILNKKVSGEMAVSIQAALGSDPVREILTLTRLHSPVWEKDTWNEFWENNSAGVYDVNAEFKEFLEDCWRI